MEANVFVKYEFHSPKRLGFYTFSNYRDRTGKNQIYKDINGTQAQIKWTSPVVLLDMNNEGHVIMDDFLKGNPSVLTGEWKRTDLAAQEKRQTKNTLDSARAIIEAAKMTDKDVVNFAMLKGYNLNADTDVLRAKIIGSAQKNPDDFMDAQFDPEKDLRVFIVEALREKKIGFKNNTFYYGREAIGTNEEQVLVWLKANKDIHAILKQEIRGDKAPAKKTKTTKVD